jgi:hypothetical protein
MIVSELKKLVPAVEAAVLEAGAEYLVTVPNDLAEQSMLNIQRALDETGLHCVVVPEGMKFYYLIPEPGLLT